MDDVLRSLRIGGSLLLREPYSSPWAIDIPSADELGTLLGTRRGVRPVAFHLVELGHCEFQPAGGESLLLNAGTIAVCFGGAAHRLSQGRRVKAQRIESLLSGGPNVQRPLAPTAASGAALLCGVFLLQHAELSPLFAALPPVLRVSVSRAGALNNLAGVARLMAEEIDRGAPGSNYVVGRLLEVLCAEAVRSYIESVPSPGPGWVRGVRDPVVGRAIAALHSNPGKRWSVTSLAQEVAMSPSRLAARFTEALGASPMAYLSRWRMNVACQELESTSRSVGEISGALGYQSAAAFNRAFRKVIGVPPATWRAREVA